MLTTAHIASGAAAGLVIKNPLLVFLFGIILHHLLDLVPHFDAGSFHSEKEKDQPLTRQDWFFILAEGFLALALLTAILVRKEDTALYFWGALGGVFPDILDNSPFWRQIRRWPFFKPYHQFHDFCHFTTRGKLIFLGFLTNAGVIILSLWFLLK